MMENISVFELVYGIFWLPTLVFSWIWFIYRTKSKESINVERTLKIGFVLDVILSTCLLILSFCAFFTERQVHSIGFIIMAIVLAFTAHSDLKAWNLAKNSESIELVRGEHVVKTYNSSHGNIHCYTRKEQ